MGDTGAEVLTFTHSRRLPHFTSARRSGIALASNPVAARSIGTSLEASPLASCRRSAAIATASAHALALSLCFALSRPALVPVVQPAAVRPAAPPEAYQLVFAATDPRTAAGAGGGGGGNRQPGPIRRAEAIGSDRITLRVAKPISTDGRQEQDAEPVPPSVVLETRSLASGFRDQPGLPAGGVSFGTSTGPGSGGGVGEGVGSGMGAGRGPGVGPGAGGGTGGGLYRPGGAVTAPRVVKEVRPTYTNDALQARVQGSVGLELIVRADGSPAEIHVVRSLDPGGLDQQAVVAVSQWRFEPGRLAGRPVDVLVTVVLDFWIH